MYGDYCNSCAHVEVCGEKADYVVGCPHHMKPVKHGRWVDRYGGKYANPLYECSECKEAALYEYRVNNLGGYYTAQALSAHCPHCGVKMDLEVQ